MGFDSFECNFLFLIFPTSLRASLLFEISRLPKKPTIKQQLKISRFRARLGKQIKDFLQSSSSFLPNLEEEEVKALEEEVIDVPIEEGVELEDPVDGFLDDDVDYEEDDETEAPSELPEVTVLPLPSNIISDRLGPSLESLRSLERELRQGQANDALEGLRISLANKSLILLQDVNKSTSTKQTTRSWDSVRNVQSQILSHASDYERARQALKRIGTPEDLALYQKLEPEHLVVVKDITETKRFGQGSDSLAWFWRIGPSKDAFTGKWMEECELNQIIFFFSTSFIMVSSLPCELVES